MSKILIACEESQEVCKAFRAKGHEAYSCDLQECSGGHPEWHIQKDCLVVMYSEHWDLCIGHPPCQYLTNAGIGYFNEERYGGKAKVRAFYRQQALNFFMAMYNAPIDRICLENPVGYVNHIIRPSQVIHPYYFGDPHKKRTCLWLKGLPQLQWRKQPDLFGCVTAVPEPQPLSVQVRKPGKHYKGGELKPRYYTDVFGGSKNSAKLRSKTFPSIAQAMADQWGNINI